ncbi:MAG: 2-amino-4-hydroxy-6-hydroxymethyldihydropteridine diphosphokinase [Dokdonella sp.]
MPASDAARALRAYVGLGSNLDDPQEQIERALRALADFAQTQLLRSSRRYRTAPWGIAEQPAFVNAVAELETSLLPRALLDALLELERAQGRHRDGARWGPRTLDLDLLMYADLQIQLPGLVLPHPRIAERAFVLVPLADLDADLVIPGAGVVRELLARVDARECVPID